MPTPFDEFRQAPLVPVAMAVSLGILVDRLVEPSPMVWIVIACVGLIARWQNLGGKVSTLVAWAALAGLYHHAIRNHRLPDDVAQYCVEPAGLARLRGVLIDEPTIQKQDRDDPFVPMRKPDRAQSVIAVRQVQTIAGWQSCSGRVRIVVDRSLDPTEPFTFTSLRIGDEIEAIGLLYRPSGPANPGEWDASDAARDKQLSADLRITKTSDAVIRWESGSAWNAAAIVASTRGRAGRVIDTALPEREAGLARALLLGDGTAMERSEWDGFVRTGVVHVLAISGQHLVVLATFLWLLFRFVGIPRKQGAWIVLAIVVGYAVLTGLRPSALRAAVMVSVMCLGLIRRKPLSLANAFAFAWLLVLVLNPTDLVNTGNLLSFISVFTLIWGLARWLEQRELTPAERLLDEFRPAWQKSLRRLGRAIAVAYAVNAILFVANSPLIAARQNLISPVGLVVGPPLVLLTEIALLAGFTMLLLGSLDPMLAKAVSWIAEWSLAACGRLVTVADHLPGGSTYLPGPPVWWLVGFYLLGAGLVLFPQFARRWLIAIVSWFALLLGLSMMPTSSDEMRVTFMSVGHGGCTVIECPDGRVLMSDVGTLAGPDAVKRHVAPYLWHRGIRRIDELFLSHADLDHFNGIPELLRRFPVGQITLTPSFAEKPTVEVAQALAAIRRANVPSRIAVAGDRFDAGGVTLDVLHPPPTGPAGSENERSLVLRVTHQGHTVLLTGDLEKQGTGLVISQPNEPIDVLMAPHHGSRAAWTAPFVSWAKPRFVVINRGGRATGIAPGDAGPSVPIWDTHNLGAITVRSHATGLTAEAFRSGERLVIKRGGR